MERIISLLNLCLYTFIGISVSGYALGLDAGISIIPECNYLDIEEGQGNAYATSKGNCCLCSKGHYYEGDCSGPDRPYDTKCTECPEGTYMEIEAHKEDMCRTPPPCSYPFIPMGGSSIQKPRCECPAGQVKEEKFVPSCIDEESAIKKSDVVDKNVIAPPVNVVTTVTETAKPTASSKIEAKVVEETTVTIDVIDHVNDEAGEDDKPLATPHRVSPKLGTTPVMSIPQPIDSDPNDQSGPKPIGIVIGVFAVVIIVLVVLLVYSRYGKKIKDLLPHPRSSPTDAAVQFTQQDNGAAVMPPPPPAGQNDRRQDSIIQIESDVESGADVPTVTEPLLSATEEPGLEDASVSQNIVPLESNNNPSRNDTSSAVGKLITSRVAENNVTQDNKADPIVNDAVGESSHCTQPRTENLPERMDQHNRPRLSAWHVIIRWKAIEIILGKITSQDLTRIGHWLIPNDNELEDIKHRCQKDGLAEVARRVFKRGLELNPKISLHEFHRTVKNMHLGYLVDVFEEHIREFEEGRDND